VNEYHSVDHNECINIKGTYLKDVEDSFDGRWRRGAQEMPKHAITCITTTNEQNRNIFLRDYYRTIE
jgi:hypothetical protein